MVQSSVAIVVDVVLVILRDSVDVYCNPVIYASLLPFIAHWRRLRIHCLPEPQVVTDDEFRTSSSQVLSF